MSSGPKRTRKPSLPLVWLPRSALANGIRISGGSGSGKSVLAGGICFQNFRQGVPQVILDPHGGTIDFFLANVWKWCQSGPLSTADQHKMWQRIYYADMSGEQGRVTTFPLFYRLGNESLHEIAQRLVSTYARLDPALMSASIEGFNALKSVLTPAGMIVTALRWQATEILDLLESPNAGAWKNHFAEAMTRYPEAKVAVDYFKQTYFQMKASDRSRRNSSLLIKLDSFRYNPTMRAIYAASQPTIDWQRVIEQDQTVLIDFRGVLDPEERRFGLLWCLFNSFVQYIRHRGKGRHHKSVALIIDELSEFGQLEAEASSSIFSEDLNYLINILKRQYRIMLTIIHQEAYQLDEKTRKALLSMGCQILGVSHDQDSALEMARQFIPYRPRAKRYEPIYSSTPDGPEVIDERQIDYSLEEQRALAAQAFTNLGRFKFLAKLSTGEGDTTGRFVPMTIEPLIGRWVPEEQIARIRALLGQRDGRPIDDVLAEIEQRTKQPQSLKSDSKRDKLKGSQQDKDDGHDHDFFI